MNNIDLSVFSSRLSAIAAHMGAVLQRTAFSPNIRDRLDFSCALFDADGALCAQAAHIPVHLGSMAYAMTDIVANWQWQEDEMVMVNDPYLGGTHLPDVTLIAPLFVEQTCVGFVANRAHHADIGADSPGSMPLSTTLAEEGLIIPPTRIFHHGTFDTKQLDPLLAAVSQAEEMRGDLAAQVSANQVGRRRLEDLVRSLDVQTFNEALQAVQDYGERLALSSLAQLPDAQVRFEDVMDDDGLGNVDIPIRVRLQIQDGRVHVDFTGTAAQVSGNINCPLSVAAAAVYYVFRCLMPPQTPACAGSFRPITLEAPAGCLVNAQRPAAVAAGNVETSTRIVDVILGALAQVVPERVPAASHGSMNNVAMGARSGSRHWDYYETLGGGMGAGPAGGGLSAVQTHMTNTLNTPVEVLETRFPLRIHRYAIRRGSGGNGQYPGGHGLIRDYEFLSHAHITLLTERRRHTPWGLAGGSAALAGENRFNDVAVGGKVQLSAQPGDRLSIATPGGGGWGAPQSGEEP